MNDEDWQGFASAFTRAVRPDDARGRAGRRMLVIGFVAALATSLGALADGALGGAAVAKPSEVAPLTPSPGPSADPALGFGVTPGTTWTGLAGPTCATNASGFAVYGYYTAAGSDGTTGWTTTGSGGYSGGGCAGGFLSLPVSGRASAYDSSRFALWTFDFSTKFTGASCRLSAYVPRNSARSLVGGHPAYFYYYGAAYDFGSDAPPLGGFVVDQVARQGRWVTGRAFDVTTGKVALKLVDAGAKDGGAARDAHAAAAQVRLTCQAT